MERVTAERFYSDPSIGARIHAQARRERAALLYTCFARFGDVLLQGVYNTRSPRVAAKERPCFGKDCSRANAS